jgi:enoyl-CoA hydratase/3-hydroxyacyl-CoA dehydrogenase
MPGILTAQRELGQPFKFNVVDLEIKEDTAVITINRPDAMNALNETVVEQLTDKFTMAEQNPQVKAILFQGAGKAFVAGADIQFFVDKIKARKIDEIEAFTRKGHELFLKIENCSKKTIALLDGLSLGGGSEMAMACQFILATNDGSMGFPETGIGIVPGLGGMIRMERHVGLDLAKYYVFTGQGMSAQEAHDLGIIYKIVTPADIMDAVKEIMGAKDHEKYRERSLPEKFQELAKTCNPQNIKNIFDKQAITGVSDAVTAGFTKTLGYKSPVALKMANDIMDKQAVLSIEEAVEFELNQLNTLFNTKDAIEGLSSVGHRKPVFTGE